MWKFKLFKNFNNLWFYIIGFYFLLLCWILMFNSFLFDFHGTVALSTEKSCGCAPRRCFCCSTESSLKSPSAKSLKAYYIPYLGTHWTAQDVCFCQGSYSCWSKTEHCAFWTWLSYFFDCCTFYLVTVANFKLSTSFNESRLLNLLAKKSECTYLVL